MTDVRRKQSAPQLVSIGDCLVTLTPTRRAPLVFAGEYRRMLAGAELNVCIGCARMQISAGLITNVGDDPLGEYILRQLRAENVDLSQTSRVKLPTALLFKEQLPGGDFRVYYHRNNAAGGAIACGEDMEKYVRDARIFLYTGIFPALSPANRRTLSRLLSAAKAGGASRAFDPNIRMKLLRTPARARRLLRPLAAECDLILLGESEASMLFGTADPDRLFACLSAEGIRHAVLKRGDRGAYAIRDGVYEEIPARPVAEVVDACGAGDAFNAGYLCALLRRRPLKECLRLAAFCGARAVSSASDNESLPFLEEAEADAAGTTEAAR
ncbi:MAG: sugar kinase [Gammaproteobacteria bacterium]